jgi:glycosyltransferase involved in cell wall biosynthesis
MTSTDRQRVLMLSEHLNSSGSPRVALNVAKHLVGSVKEVAMGYLWGSDALVSEFEDAGVSTVRLGDRFGDPTVLRSLWDLISAYRPTLVHTHMIPASWCGRVVGRLRGVPVVSTIHTPYDDRSLPARGLDLSTSSLPAVNVAVSNAVADSFPPYFGIGTRSAVVHNCIDVEELRARGTVAWEDLEWNEGLSKEQPIVANVARFDPKKRKSDLVRALPVVLEEFPETIVVLTGWEKGGPASRNSSARSASRTAWYLPATYETPIAFIATPTSLHFHPCRRGSVLVC